MARDPKEDNLAKTWEQRVKRGVDYREKYGRSADWKDWRDAYRGKWAPNIVPVNRTFSYIRSSIPRTYFRNPSLVVTPRRPEFTWRARLIESIDNYLIRETDLKHTLKTAILQAAITGTGPIKLGFDSEFGYVPDQAITSDGETITQQDTKDGSLIEYNQGVKPGLPWALPALPETVIVPWGYRIGQAMPWIAHKVIRPLEDVKHDQKYNSFRKELQGGFTRDKDASIDDPLMKDDINYTQIIEIRDFKRKKIISICESMTLLEVEDALQIEGMPWEFIIFNEDPEFFWGISDVGMLFPQQEELNDIRTSASRHRKIAGLKFLYLKGALDPKDLERIVSTEFVPAIGIQGESLANIIMELQPHIPPDLMGSSQMIEQDIRETMGYSSNQSGEFAGRMTPPTATEVNKVSEGSGIRVDERRDIVADVMVNILRKWNQYIGKFWETEQVQHIVGPDGIPVWVSYKGSDLVGEYDLLLDPDSTLPLTKQLKFSQSMQMFQMFNGDQFTDQMKLRQMVLKNAAHIDPNYEMLQSPQQNPNPPTNEMMAAMIQGGMPKPSIHKPGTTSENPKQMSKL